MNNCFLYLLHSSEEDIRDFHKSISLLYEHYLKDFPCDVLLFHEKDLDWGKFQLPPNITFIKCPLQFSIPSFLPTDNIPEFFPHPTHGPGGPHDCGHKGFTLGYRHMCGFFAGAMYNEYILQKYDYYCRLDTDSFILRKIGFDIFEKMAGGNYIYGYMRDAVQLDNPAVIRDLWTSVEKYANSQNKSIQHIPEGTMYYTNFELGKVDWFIQNYMGFFDYVDRTGGIYTKRWGDAPIKYLGINLLAKPERLWAITEIAYEHGGIYNF